MGVKLPFTVKDYRRARLLELLNGPRFKGDRAEFVRLTGLSNARISQLLDPKEPFGDTAARRLTLKLGLPHGYFDEPQHGGFTPGARAVAATFDRMTESDRARFLRLLEAMFGGDPDTRPGELGGPVRLPPTLKPNGGQPN